MIEWKQGEPPRDGKWYLVLHAQGVIDCMAYLPDTEGASAWWNTTDLFVDACDFGPDYWAEINLPEGYRVHAMDGK